jgi:single-stranded-DNA-specific exonuclease
MKQYRMRVREHDDLLEDMLLARGVTEPQEREKFLTPDFERDSHDPFLLPDMAAAVERLLSAQKNNEAVAVWSDYDCDGIPGGVMLTDFLRECGLTVIHYIPHRHTEGYGLNTEGLDELKEQGVSLVVTVDLGTTDVEPVEHAKKLGIDIIVTDHHIVSPGHAKPFALINPKRPDSKYSFDGLCGAGVAWKLVQAILSKNRPEALPEGQEKWYLDLVGIATLSDMVPLVGENRMLAHFGLTVARRARRPGLVALLSLLRIKPAALTEDDVGFMVSPRINAASRMDSPHIAAKLLSAKEKQEADELALTLNKINDERKGVVAATVKEINKRLVGIDLTKSPLIVMGNPNWRPGVLGLVANKLAEAHGKPVFLWGREGGETIRGSVRSDGVTNVVELMSEVRELFDDFGGHHASGGFSLAEERVHELPARLASAFEKISSQAPTQIEMVIDRESSVAEVPHALSQLKKLAPFGVGNEKPLFIFPHTTISNVRQFGKAQDHLEVSLECEGASTSGIAFFSTPDSFNKKVVAGARADVVGHIETDWQGRPRIRVVDIL